VYWSMCDNCKGLLSNNPVQLLANWG